MAVAPALTLDDDYRLAIISLLEKFSTETTPVGATKIASFRDHLRPGTSVFITFLPGSDFSGTVATARRLRNEGFNPVPHLAARSIPSVRFLEEGLSQLSGEAGVTEALLIGGAISKPVGVFDNSMQVLETGLLDRHGFQRIGVAGHPEGSPDIRREDVAAALAWKNAFARRTGADLYIVTQFCFEAAPVIAWDRMIQAEGNRLPIRIGIPGLASVKTLLNYARMCGIGPSMNFLTRQARNVTKLLTLTAPDRLLADLAAYRLNDSRCGIVGCHIYPLGGLEKSARWMQATVEGRFSLSPQGNGFSVGV